ncbi:hypothetical protein HDK77DRAFT_195550 [Phyllosticta capitalensis]
MRERELSCLNQLKTNAQQDKPSAATTAVVFRLDLTRRLAPKPVPSTPSQLLETSSHSIRLAWVTTSRLAMVITVAATSCEIRLSGSVCALLHKIKKTSLHRLCVDEQPLDVWRAVRRTNPKCDGFALERWKPQYLHRSDQSLPTRTLTWHIPRAMTIIPPSTRIVFQTSLLPRPLLASLPSISTCSPPARITSAASRTPRPNLLIKLWRPRDTRRRQTRTGGRETGKRQSAKCDGGQPPHEHLRAPVRDPDERKQRLLVGQLALRSCLG